MTHNEWTRKLIVKLASGHMNAAMKDEARLWLDGKEPPEKWEPKAKKLHEMAKKAEPLSTTILAVPGLKVDGENKEG